MAASSGVAAAPMPLDSIMPLLGAKEFKLLSQGVEAFERWLLCPPSRPLTAAEQGLLQSALGLYEPLLRCSNYKVNFGALRCLQLQMQFTHTSVQHSHSHASSAAALLGLPSAAWPLKASWTPLLLELLVEKLSDAHAALRVAAHDCILELHACAGFGTTFERLARILDAAPGHAHRAPLIRAGVLGVFLAIEKMYGSLAVLNSTPNTMRRLLESVLRAVADPSASVREQAMQALEVLYAHVGDEVLLRLSSVPPSVLRPAQTRVCFERLQEVVVQPEHVRISLSTLSAPVLVTRMRPQAANGGEQKENPAAANAAQAALVKLKQQQSARRLSRGARFGSGDSDSGSGGLSATLMPDAAYISPVRATLSPSSPSAASATSAFAFAAGGSPQSPAAAGPLAPSVDVKPVLLYEPRELEAELVKLSQVLKDIVSHGWQDRVAAMKRLQSLVLGGAQHFDNFPGLLRFLREPLGAQILDLRSSIVREACVTLSLLGKALGEGFEPFLDYFVPILFKLLLVTIQVIKESGNDCIRNLLQSSCACGGGSAGGAGSAQHAKIVTKLFEGTVAHNAVLRLRCMEYILLLLEIGNRSLVEKHANLLHQCLKARLGDKHEEVRQKARQATCAYLLLAPQAAQRFLDKEVDARTNKMVAEERVKYELMRNPDGVPLNGGTRSRPGSRQASQEMEFRQLSPKSGGGGGTSGMHGRSASGWSSGSDEKEFVGAPMDDDSDPARPALQPRRVSSRMSLGGAGGTGGVMPARGAHAHAASVGGLSASAKRSTTVMATPQQTGQHARTQSLSASARPPRTDMGGTAATALDLEAAWEVEQNAQAAAAALSASTRSASASRGRSRVSGTPAGLAQSQRASSTVRGSNGSVACATPAATSAAPPALARVRSASAVRGGPANLGSTTALTLGPLPVSPAQAMLGKPIATAAAPGSSLLRRELLDEPLSHSQRSQLIQSLLDQTRDSDWAKRVHALEQLAVIFRGGSSAADATAPDAAPAGPVKKIPELFVHLDKIALALRASLGDVHHRVATAAIQGCFALLTPLPDPAAAGQMTEAELRPAVERVLPDVFALLSHPKLALREQANSLLNHLTTHFAMELLLGVLVYKSLDSVNTTAPQAAHPSKIRLAMLEYVHYLIPLSGSYFRTLATLSDASGTAYGSQAGAVVNPPMRALLTRIAPLLSSSIDSTPSSKEPALRKLCLGICTTFYLSFAASFFPSLACLSHQQNRLVRKALIQSLPELEKKIAEQQQQKGGNGAAAMETQHTQQQQEMEQQQQHDLEYEDDPQLQQQQEVDDEPYDAPPEPVAAWQPPASSASSAAQAPVSRQIDFTRQHSEDSSGIARAPPQQQQQQKPQQPAPQPHQQQQRPPQRPDPRFQRAFSTPSQFGENVSAAQQQPQQQQQQSERDEPDDYEEPLSARSQSSRAPSSHQPPSEDTWQPQSQPQSYRSLPPAVEARPASASPKASFSEAYISSLLHSLSSSSDPMSRQSAFVQLEAYARSPHTVWASYFERVLLALLDLACAQPPKSPPGAAAEDASDLAARAEEVAASISSSLRVLESLLQVHASHFTAQPNGARYLELLLRSMLQVMRTTQQPAESRTSSQSGGGASSSSLSAQASVVFQLSAALAPSPLLLRLLLHVLSTEHAHEGVLKLCLQRLAAVIDERLDSAALGTPAAEFGLNASNAGPSSSGAVPPTVVSCIVHALSLCTHTAVLVRKLVITAFVRLYARLGGALLPHLDGLNPMLVKLVHIYIDKYDQQQQQQQQQTQQTQSASSLPQHVRRPSADRR